MERPEFKDIKTYEEFIKYYWYREELEKICKDLKIDHKGQKQYLNHVIEEYYKENKIKPQKSISVKKKDIELTLDTKLLESGFAMRNEYRDFFGKQVGVSNFKFTANMAAAIKKVRQEKNKEFTVKDLIDVYYGNSDYATFDSSSCQWNQFVKDFHQDKESLLYKDKHKVVSILWKKLRSSTKDKVFSHDLFIQFKEDIEDYKK